MELNMEITPLLDVPVGGLGPDRRVPHNVKTIWLSRSAALTAGYIAGLMGRPSLPGTYAEGDRRAYERGYDIGRRARLDEAP
jgi:hypothetical protein